MINEWIKVNTVMSFLLLRCGEEGVSLCGTGCGSATRLSTELELCYGVLCCGYFFVLWLTYVSVTNGGREM